MKVQIPAPGARSMLDHLAERLGLDIEQDCQRSSIVIPEHLGKGDLISYTLSEGADAFIFSGRLNSDWEIVFNRNEQAPITFFTVAEGALSCTHTDPQVEDLHLEPLESAIYVAPKKGERKWYLKKEEDLLFVSIAMHKQVFFQDIKCEPSEIAPGLLEILTDLRGKKNFRFNGIFHLPIVEALQAIVEQEEVGLLNSTFATSKLYEIVFYQIQQYEWSQKASPAPSGQSSRAIEIIQNAEQILVSRLQDPPTIPALARLAGINQQDLKKGFKQLYGQTIKQYLNEKRLEQAEFLIKSGQLKLQDVALEVGYSNAGHFSRRFKEKYGVTPKYYKRQAVGA